MKVVAEYDYYTLDQAREILEEEEKRRKLVEKFWRDRRRKVAKEKLRMKCVELFKDVAIALVAAVPMVLMFLHWLFIGY